MFRFPETSRSSHKQEKPRRGFTLAEVLVTLAIIAVMAAVLLPALNQQLSKGDTGRLASDLTSIQTGAQAFLSDVHRYPRTVSQLMTALNTSGSNSLDISGTAIPFTLAARWKGPYISRDVLATTGGGGTILDAFTTVSSTLAVQIDGLSTADANRLETTFDEGTSASTSSTAGNVRLVSGSSTVLFLALPIQ